MSGRTDAPAGAEEGEGPAWEILGPPLSCFPEGFFRRPAPMVARDLLGVRLRSSIEGRVCTGVIVETEAYLGPEDPASHAATRAVTARNRAMFGPPGRAYVYRSHGIHWCFNVVTGEEGEGQAVLVRGLDPLDGIDVMLERRGGRRPLAAGPGRLGQALGVGPEHYGHDLSRSPLQLLPGWTLPEHRVKVTGRVGIRKAAEWPLRFLVRERPGVSRASVHPGDPAGLPPNPALHD